MKIHLLIIFIIAQTYADADIPDTLKEYHVGNTKFAVDLFKELLKSKSDNVLVCPLSAHIALAMAQIGAGGETAIQLSHGTHLPKESSKVVDIFSEVIPQLESSDKYTFEIANKVYVYKSFKTDEQYINTLVNNFKANIQNINFTDPKAASEMNQWVAEKTHNKITNLIDQNDLDDDTRLMILNAMFFKGVWVNGFKDDNTKERPFFLNDTHYIDTKMMSTKASFNYYEDSKLNAAFLEMPYKGDDVSMTIVLPNSPEGLHVLENNLEIVLAPPKYDKKINVEVRIPKFEIKSTLKLKKILESLGVHNPFNDGADFSGMIASDEIDPLKIGDVIQKATIEVDEKGTIATASTAVMMQTWRSAKILDNIYFYADHPFIFYLKHKIAGITFIGRYSKPFGSVQIGKYEKPINPILHRVHF